ncbi:MAG: hypothetical protein N4A71_13440 [Carboxylicivirga sp.]|jgi:hypothetical protein|nr:hypothetical protein [Carboxylicivirga sp.]MCT4623442.1 hypothetical protein [Schleiferiaceae bacterium]
MDKIIQITARILFRTDIKIRRVFYSRIMRNNTSLILFILSIYCVYILTLGLVLDFSLQVVIILSASFILALFLLLFLVASLREARRLKREQLSNTLQFKRSNLNGTSLDELGFSEIQREDLIMVLNNLKPNKKIDFQLVSDNRIAADYKKLFRILHLLADGGIREFKKERKEMLFKFIEVTFTMNGSEVNRASLNSRFSEWINENETEFSENLKPIRKKLSI